jgi:hypothetical protein
VKLVRACSLSKAIFCRAFSIARFRYSFELILDVIVAKPSAITVDAALTLPVAMKKGTNY